MNDSTVIGYIYLHGVFIVYLILTQLVNRELSDQEVIRNKIYLKSKFKNKYNEESNEDRFCVCYRLFVITVIPFDGKRKFLRKNLQDSKSPLILKSNEHKLILKTLFIFLCIEN